MSKFKHTLPYSPTLKMTKLENIPENVEIIDPPSPIAQYSPIYNGTEWIWPSTSDSEYDNINTGAISPPAASSTPLNDCQSNSKLQTDQNSEKSPENNIPKNNTEPNSQSENPPNSPIEQEEVKTESHAGDTTIDYNACDYIIDEESSPNSPIVIDSSPLQNSPLEKSVNHMNSPGENLSDSVEVVPETQEILDPYPEYTKNIDQVDKLLQQLKSNRENRKRTFTFAAKSKYTFHINIFQKVACKLCHYIS